MSEEPPNSMIETYFSRIREQAADWRNADCLILGEPISTLEYAQQLRLQQEAARAEQDNLVDTDDERPAD